MIHKTHPSIHGNIVIVPLIILTIHKKDFDNLGNYVNKDNAFIMISACWVYRFPVCSLENLIRRTHSGIHGNIVIVPFIISLINHANINNLSGCRSKIDDFI